MNIPNALSLFRIILVPVFVAVFFSDTPHAYTIATAVFLAAGLTDVLDGRIARKYGQITKLGRLLDPLADKLTQAAMLICLTSRYPLMLLPFGMMVVKEIFCIVSGLAAINRTGEVEGSDWHGKAATVLLYITLLVHLLWPEVPPRLTLALVVGCMGLILLSGVLYGIQNFNRIAAAKGEQ